MISKSRLLAASFTVLSCLWHSSETFALGCCEYCEKTTKACYNKCIPIEEECRKGPGCACDVGNIVEPKRKTAEERRFDKFAEKLGCCKVCANDLQACGDGCIPKNDFCNKPVGCACDSRPDNGEKILTRTHFKCLGSGPSREVNSPACCNISDSRSLRAAGCKYYQNGSWYDFK